MFVLLVRPAGVFPIKTRPDTYTENPSEMNDCDWLFTEVNDCDWLRLVNKPELGVTTNFFLRFSV